LLGNHPSPTTKGGGYGCRPNFCQKDFMSDKHICTLDAMLKNTQITDDEYAFLKGGGVRRCLARIDNLRRGEDIEDVFHSLAAEQITVAKCLDVVRTYLMTGVIENYGGRAEGIQSGEYDPLPIAKAGSDKPLPEPWPPGSKKTKYHYQPKS
jgi:hypothetical protein